MLSMRGRGRQAAPAVQHHFGDAFEEAETFQLLVLTPMPAGVLWSASEFRRYLRGLGHKPLPLVSEIVALLSEPACEEYGVRQLASATSVGGMQFGTTPSMARRRLQQGRPAMMTASAPKYVRRRRLKPAAREDPRPQSPRRLKVPQSETWDAWASKSVSNPMLMEDPPALRELDVNTPPQRQQRSRQHHRDLLLDDDESMFGEFKVGYDNANSMRRSAGVAPHASPKVSLLEAPLLMRPPPIRTPPPRSPTIERRVVAVEEEGAVTGSTLDALYRRRQRRGDETGVEEDLLAASRAVEQSAEGEQLATRHAEYEEVVSKLGSVQDKLDRARFDEHVHLVVKLGEAEERLRLANERRIRPSSGDDDNESGGLAARLAETEEALLAERLKSAELAGECEELRRRVQQQVVTRTTVGDEVVGDSKARMRLQEEVFAAQVESRGARKEAELRRETARSLERHVEALQLELAEERHKFRRLQAEQTESAGATTREGRIRAAEDESSRLLEAERLEKAESEVEASRVELASCKLKCVELETTMETSSRDDGELEARCAAFEAQLERSAAAEAEAASEFAEKFAEKQHELEGKQGELEAAEVQIEERSEELCAAKLALAELQTTSEAERHEGGGRELQARSEELAMAKLTLAQVETEAEAQRGLHAALTRRVEELTLLLDAERANCAALSALLAERECSLAELKIASVELEAQCDARKRDDGDLENREMELATFKMKCAELEILNQELEEMKEEGEEGGVEALEKSMLGRAELEEKLRVLTEEKVADFDRLEEANFRQQQLEQELAMAKLQVAEAAMDSDEQRLQARKLAEDQEARLLLAETEKLSRKKPLTAGGRRRRAAELRKAEATLGTMKQLEAEMASRLKDRDLHRKQLDQQKRARLQRRQEQQNEETERLKHDEEAAEEEEAAAREDMARRKKQDEADERQVREDELQAKLDADEARQKSADDARKAKQSADARKAEQAADLKAKQAADLKAKEAAKKKEDDWPSDHGDDDDDDDGWPKKEDRRREEEPMMAESSGESSKGEANNSNRPTLFNRLMGSTQDVVSPLKEPPADSESESEYEDGSESEEEEPAPSKNAGWLRSRLMGAKNEPPPAKRGFLDDDLSDMDDNSPKRAPRPKSPTSPYSAMDDSDEDLGSLTDSNN